VYWYYIIIYTNVTISRDLTSVTSILYVHKKLEIINIIAQLLYSVLDGREGSGVCVCVCG